MISAATFTGALLAMGVFFAALLAWRENTAQKRENDLLNRLMARDLPEYTQQTQQQEQEPRDPHRRHNIIANNQARQRGEASDKPANRANPLLSPDN